MFCRAALDVCLSGFAESVLDKEGFHEKKRKIGLEKIVCRFVESKITMRRACVGRSNAHRALHVRCR
jgi:hypothetical protein